MHNTSNERRHTAALSKYMQLGLHTMTPVIIAHYLVAIAVIAVFLTIALIREALLREAADRRRDEEFDRIRAAKRIERRAAFAARYGCEVKA